MPSSTTTTKYTTPSLFSPSTSASTIEIDPSAPGTPIRFAFAAEATLNLFTFPLLLYPRQTLSYLVADPSYLSPTTDLLGQLFAGLVIGALTPALLLGLPNTRMGIEARKVVYLVLGGGELALIPLFVNEALNGGRGFSAKACWMSVGSLLPPLAWRMYALFVRPEMFGRYREVGKKAE